MISLPFDIHSIIFNNLDLESIDNLSKSSKCYNQLIKDNLVHICLHRKGTRKSIINDIEFTYLENKLHSFDNKPSVIYPNGSKVWHRHDTIYKIETPKYIKLGNSIMNKVTSHIGNKDKNGDNICRVAYSNMKGIFNIILWCLSLNSQGRELYQLIKYDTEKYKLWFCNNIELYCSAYDNYDYRDENVIVFPNDNTVYVKKEKIHNIGNPAVITKNEKIWIEDGIIKEYYSDELQKTYKDGLLHSFDDKPAVKYIMDSYYVTLWFNEGKLERIGKPAIIISKNIFRYEHECGIPDNFCAWMKDGYFDTSLDYTVIYKPKEDPIQIYMTNKDGYVNSRCDTISMVDDKFGYYSDGLLLYEYFV